MAADRRVHSLAKRRRKVRLHPRVSVIIPVRNESSMLKRNLAVLKRWPLLKEIIVVANGCTDDTAEISKSAGVKVIEFAEPLGHDTGRAVGAKHATGKYLLFIDADIAWRLMDFGPFIRALRKGADVALNAYPNVQHRFYHHATAVAKRALNIALERPDLKAASLTTVPHAIRRSVVAAIGHQSLAIPPLAHARALLADCKVVIASFVNVNARNRWRRTTTPDYSIRDMIIGDHLEAFEHVIQARGSRAGFDDMYRNRNLVHDFKGDRPPSHEHAVVAIIPARNEAKTLPRVLREVKRAQVRQVFVVENGSRDGTEKTAKAHGARVYHFDDPIGHDVGRAIGASAASQSKCAVFLDSDFAVPREDIDAFVKSVLNERVDVALNDLSSGMKRWQLCDAVSTVKSFLNIALGRGDLGVASLTAVPHALSKRALQTLQPDDLVIPPKAMVRAVTSNLNVRSVQFVDVISRNRYRLRSHSARHGAPVRKLIIGDHVEAIALLLQLRGSRAGFVQPRKLSVLDE